MLMNTLFEIRPMPASRPKMIAMEYAISVVFIVMASPALMNTKASLYSELEEMTIKTPIAIRISAKNQ